MSNLNNLTVKEIKELLKNNNIIIPSNLLRNDLIKYTQTHLNTQPNILILVGTSTAGKSYIIDNYLLPNIPNSIAVTADGVFKELVKEHPRTPYKDIKPLVNDRLAQEIRKESKKHFVIVDHIFLNFLDKISNLNYHLVLIYTPLEQIAINLKKRPAGDKRFALGILDTFCEFYTRANQQDEIIDVISYNDIIKLLEIDNTVTKLNAG